MASSDAPASPTCDACGGLVDFLYATWWRCRRCNRWQQQIQVAHSLLTEFRRHFQPSHKFASLADAIDNVPES